MQSLMDGQSQLDAAKQIGISKSNITRWKDGARAAPDFVVKVARAYGANVLDALVEAEFITEDEAALKEVGPDVAAAIRLATDDQLTDEILRRLKLGSRSFDTPVDDLAARRSNTTSPGIRPVVDDDDPLAGIDPQQYAAHPRTENLEEDNPTP